MFLIHEIFHNYRTAQIFDRGKNLTNLTNFQQFVNIFPIKIFHLVRYSMLMIGIHQFFTRQNFPNPDSSEFSTVKILCHTVSRLVGIMFQISLFQISLKISLCSTLFIFCCFFYQYSLFTI